MMQFEKSRDFNSNGQLYRIGVDKYGWITIQPFRRFEIDGKEHEVKEEQGNTVSFPPDMKEEVGEYIKNL